MELSNNLNKTNRPSLKELYLQIKFEISEIKSELSKRKQQEVVNGS